MCVYQPALLCQTTVRLHHGGLKQLVMHLYWTNGNILVQGRKCRSWVQDKFTRLQAVVRILAESVSFTSTDSAAAWNQASIPPLPLPAAEDPEGVDPSDTSPPAVVSGAVALIHGSTTYNFNFNDKSSADDHNVDFTADGHTSITTSSPSDCCDVGATAISTCDYDDVDAATSSITNSTLNWCDDGATACTTTSSTCYCGDVGVDATTTSSTCDCGDVFLISTFKGNSRFQKLILNAWDSNACCSVRVFCCCFFCFCLFVCLLLLFLI